jgi:hypothetical protein
VHKNDIVNCNVVTDTYVSVYELHICPVVMRPLYTVTAREVLSDLSGL